MHSLDFQMPSSELWNLFDAGLLRGSGTKQGTQELEAETMVFE